MRLSIVRVGDHVIGQGRQSNIDRKGEVHIGSRILKRKTIYLTQQVPLTRSGPMSCCSSPYQAWCISDYTLPLLNAHTNITYSRCHRQSPRFPLGTACCILKSLDLWPVPTKIWLELGGLATGYKSLMMLKRTRIIIRKVARSRDMELRCRPCLCTCLKFWVESSSPSPTNSPLWKCSHRSVKFSDPGSVMGLCHGILQVEII